MATAAIVILAGTDSHADLGRLVNGLETAAEFADNPNDEVALLFDGAGTQWIPELEDESHDYHALYRSIRNEVVVCDYCANAFGVDDIVDEADIITADENGGHPSIRSLVDDGSEIITF